jgi:hypothetical protein
MATGYEDIDRLMGQQSQYLEEQKDLQNQIVDKGLQKTQNEIDKQKQEYDENAVQTAKGLYTNYQKARDPYGVNSEQLASQGLNKSGYAESSQVNLYNTYQKNITTLMAETNKLKANADFQMNQALIEADIQKAKNTLAIYQQQADLALQEYQLRYQKQRDLVSDSQWQQNYDFNKQRADVQDSQWQQGFDFNKERANVQDSQWQQQFDWNKNSWQQQMDYQRQRDAVADSQWERQYQLSLQNSR